VRTRANAEAPVAFGVPAWELLPESVPARLPGVSEAEARKILAHVFREGVFPTLGAPSGVAQVRRTALDALREYTSLPSLECSSVHRSAVDPFVKYAFRTADDHLIETVRIPLEKTGRYSVCVSSQVGCALGCTFCATGRLGLSRNLEIWEIILQVRAVRATLVPGERIRGVVFQGMGEPLANRDRVIEAISILSHPALFAIDGRAMTVCTSGLPAGIEELARRAPRVRLGISIGSAREDVRRTIMPISRAHPLTEVMEACVHHTKASGYAPMWALTLLDGINDADEDAEALAALAVSFTERSGRRPRISIIPYNAIGPSDPYRRVSPEREARFRALLNALGAPTKKRYSGGGDVAAACGQLAARVS